MFYQEDNYRCGVYALLSSFEAIDGSKGIGKLAASLDLSEAAYGKSRRDALHSLVKEVGRIAGTTSKNGTSLAGMKRAIRYFGYTPVRYTSKISDNAWRWITKWSPISPIILCVDRDQHYSTITGLMDNRAVLVDPDPSLEHGENGVYMLGKQDLLDRWLSHRGLYRAIRVSRA